jgi:hypothetical protein
MRKALLLLMPLILLLTNCKKSGVSPDGLPAITQTGANTFGAKVNGKVFLPRANFGGASKLTVSYNKGQSLQISGSDNKANPLISIDFGAGGLTLNSGDVLPLKSFDASGDGIGVQYVLIDGNVDNYTVVSGTPGKITILKLDEANRIISATFSFEAVNKTGDKVSVTDGRFDLKY